MKAVIFAILGLGILLAVLVTYFLQGVMPSYLAAWLFAAAIPFGALPVVMLSGLFSRRFFLAGVLRAQLLLAPLAALAVIPLLVRLRPLFPAGLPHATSFAHFWFGGQADLIRIVICLFLWTFLALLFARPLRVFSPQVAILGLLAHLIIGTVIANDLVMTVEPHWHASDFGVLFIVTQAAVAVSFAVLCGVLELRFVLLAILAAWIFLQFTQFLIIWSGDLPSEIPWYLHRDSGFGWVAEAGGFALGVVVPALFLLLPARLPQRLGAMLALIVQAFNMLWFITPSYRGNFTVTGIDIAEMAALAAVAFGCVGALSLMRVRA